MFEFLVDNVTNTLIDYSGCGAGEHVDYIVVPHLYKGQQIDRIGAHCFGDLRVQMLCIEEGVNFMEDEAFHLYTHSFRFAQAQNVMKMVARAYISVIILLIGDSAYYKSRGGEWAVRLAG